jgi:hypothetical protein
MHMPLRDYEEILDQLLTFIIQVFFASNLHKAKKQKNASRLPTVPVSDGSL